MNPAIQLGIGREDYCGESRTIVLQEDYEEEAVYRPHRDPRYRPGAVPKTPSHRQVILALMAKHLDYAIVISWVAFVFSFSILADYVLPKEKKEVEIVGHGISSGGTFQLKFNDGSVLNVSKKACRIIKGTSLTLHVSKFFRIPYKIEDKEKNLANVEISVYGNFIFGPFLLFITSLIGMLHNKGVEFRYNVGVVSFILACLNLAFLNIHKF